MQPVERKRHETDLYRLIQTEDFPIASVKTSGGLRLAALLSNVTAVWTGEAQLAADAIIVLKHTRNNYRSDCQDFNQIRIRFGASPPLPFRETECLTNLKRSTKTTSINSQDKFPQEKNKTTF